MRVTNFYEIYLFMASYIVSWNRNAFSHWPIGVIVVFIIQQQKVEYNNARLGYSHPPILHGYLESWLFGQLVILYCKKTLFDQSAERATFLYSLCFSRLMRNEHRNLAEKRASPSLNIQEEEVPCTNSPLRLIFANKIVLGKNPLKNQWSNMFKCCRVWVRNMNYGTTSHSWQFTSTFSLQMVKSLWFKPRTL